jgi:hypothetical protein
MTPTDEQIIARDAFATGGDVVVSALAGTGKTATLALIAESTNRRGQYLAFNRALITDAAGRFPSTIAANTVHSLAFRAVGRHYKARLDNSRRMSSMDIARILQLDPLDLPTGAGSEKRRLSPGFLAGHVMRGVDRFCQSADPVPSGEHVPYVDGLDLPQPDGRKGWANNRELRRYLAPYLTRAWMDLCQKSGQLRFSHGAYLKMWELSGPVIDADFILWDEVQDTSGVMESIVLQQKDTQVVAVGDAQQAIYGWMGAIDALTAFEERADATATLTQSFRSGPAIAAAANVLLEELGTDLRLRGHDDIHSAVTTERLVKPAAVLCRTNAVSVRRVISHRAAGQKVALVGDGSDVLRFARAADELQTRGHTSHPDLACFADWDAVRYYVQADALGGELKLLVQLVDEFGVPVIESALSGLQKEASADVVVSTAHKSKGRQWPTVALADDFPVSTAEKPLEPEELRLQYVAVTRAQNVLDLSACPTLATTVGAENA